MDDRPHDDDLRALRAHDPASGTTAPDALRERVAALAAAPETALGPPRRTRRRGWLVAAAAVVAVAAVGGAFMLTPHDSVETVALTTPAPGEIAPPIGSGVGTGDTRANGGAMPRDAEFQLNGDVRAGWGGWWGHQRFVTPAFDDTAGAAHVYALDRAQYVTAETLARIATALGVPGEPSPSEYGEGWWMGAPKESEPSLSIDPWNGGQVHYWSGVPDPVQRCVEAATADDPEPDWQSAYEQCRIETPRPTEQQVRDAMSAFLDALGIDESTVSVTVDDEEGEFSSGTYTARAARIVDGVAAPVWIWVAVSTEGLLHATATIGDIVSLGEYDIVSPAEAAARLNTSAFPPELTFFARSDGDAEMPIAEENRIDPVPEPGSAVPWSITEHEIVSARLGLTTVFGSYGTFYVVPAYEFTDAEGNRWSVIALAEEELDTAATLW